MTQDVVEEEVSLNPQEEETPLESQEEVEVKPEPKKVEVKSKAEEVAENYKIRAEKAEKELKRLSKTPQSSDSEWKNKVEFLIKNREYNEEEFDHIATVSARKGISLDEAAKAENDYITFRREKVNNNNKTPSPSSAGFPSFEKKITKDTPPEEIERILAERAKQAQGSNTGY